MLARGEVFSAQHVDKPSGATMRPDEVHAAIRSLASKDVRASMSRSAPLIIDFPEFCRGRVVEWREGLS